MGVISQGCDFSNVAKLHGQLPCSVAGCEEMLTHSNSFTCATCEADVCSEHRSPENHGCLAGRDSPCSELAEPHPLSGGPMNMKKGLAVGLGVLAWLKLVSVLAYREGSGSRHM